MKKINRRAHWEIARADEQAANYALKDGDYEKKDYRKQGQRTDVRLAIETLRVHGLKRVKLDHPLEFLKYPSGFAALDVLNEDERDFEPDVLWIYGTTGTGKSHFAKHVYPHRKRWWSGKNLRWWQGYRGEDIAIIDDFRKDFCTFHELLRILDKYPYPVEVKGSHRQLNSKFIIITTIAHPRDLYKFTDKGDATDPERLDQLMRRITKVVKATKSGDEWSMTPDAFINRNYQHAIALGQLPTAGQAEAPPISPHGSATPTGVVSRRTAPVAAAGSRISSLQEHENGGPLADQDTEERRSGTLARAGDDGHSDPDVYLGPCFNSNEENGFWEEELARDQEETFFNVPEGL